MALVDYKISQILENETGKHVLARFYEGTWEKDPETGEQVFIRTAILATDRASFDKATPIADVREATKARMLDATKGEEAVANKPEVTGK